MALSIRTTRRQPPRIVVYGPPKVGKSTFAAGAPSPLFLPLEDGIGTLDVPVIAGPSGKLETWSDMLEALDIAELSDARTIIVDSITAAQDLVFAEVAREERVPSIAHVPYGKGYPRALSKWLGMLARLDQVRGRGKAIVLIGHAQTEQYADPEGEAYDRHALRLHQQAEGRPSLRAATMEWADVLAFAAIRTMRKTTGEGFRERTLAVGSERVLYTAPSPARAAGSRFPLPPEMPLDWTAFATALRAAYAAPQTSSTTTSQPAAPAPEPEPEPEYVRPDQQEDTPF